MIKRYVASNSNFVSLYGTIYKLNNFSTAKIRYSIYPEVSTPENMTSNEDENWLITSSGNLDSGVEPFNAFTGIPPTNNNGWHSNGTQPFWIAWQNKIKKVLIKKLNITPYFYNDAWTSSLNSIRLDGSNDGSNWTEIATLNGTYGNKITVTHLINNNDIGYFYHRIYSLTPSSYMTVGNIDAYRDI